MTPVLALASLFVFGGLLTYTLVERRHQPKWALANRGLLVRRRAPQTIRRTALWSIYMGQMAVPGGLLGLFGTLIAGIGLVSIPGLILAVGIWRLGYAMLRRDPNAAEEARKLERFAVVLNVITVVVALVLALDPDLWGLSAFLIAYAGVSFAHAKAMGRCAELLAAEARLDASLVCLSGAAKRAPVRVDPRAQPVLADRCA
jgi:hypothetical protein